MVSLVVPLREGKNNALYFLNNIFYECERYLNSYEIIVAENSDNNDVYQEVERFIHSFPCKKEKILLIKTSFDGGMAEAIRCGIMRTQGEEIVIVMADLCDCIADITKMQKLLEGALCDVVVGNRNYNWGKGRDNRYCFLSVVSFLGSFFLKMIIPVSIHDFTNSFRMYRRFPVQRVCREKFVFSGREFSYELLLRLIRKKYVVREIPTVWKKRAIGVSHFSLVDVWKYVYLTLLYLYGKL